MVVTMDLNASPVPEEDDENFEGHIEEYSAPEERFETAVETARRVFLNFIFAYALSTLHENYAIFLPNYVIYSHK